MSMLRGVFDKVRPAFSDYGRLHRLAPLFDAMENFFFWTNTRTPGSPHVRDPLDIKRFMSMVVIAMLPALAASTYFFGWRIIAMIVVSYAAGGAVEVLFACVRKEEVNEGFLVTGLLFPLVLPPTLPLWMVAVGVAFGVLVGKEIFGGTGRNLFNPALVGRCFLFLSYSKAMTTRWLDPAQGNGMWGMLGEYAKADAITSATPLGNPEAGWRLMDLLLGGTPGTVGGTCSLAILAGGVFLLATRVSNWRIPVAMLGAFAALGAALAPSGLLGELSLAHHLLAGGLLFGAMFMATDPVSAPSTNPARWAYGILIGVLTILIRTLTPLPEGVMFSILLGNVAAPTLDHVVIRLRLRRLARER